MSEWAEQETIAYSSYEDTIRQLRDDRERLASALLSAAKDLDYCDMPRLAKHFQDIVRETMGRSE
jgi:hypothetical protein